jgi:hypothetical protein
MYASLPLSASKYKGTEPSGEKNRQSHDRTLQIRVGLSPQCYKSDAARILVLASLLIGRLTFPESDHASRLFARSLHRSGQRRCCKPHRCSRFSRFFAPCEVHQRLWRRWRLGQKGSGTRKEFYEAEQHIDLRVNLQCRGHKCHQFLHSQHWRWHPLHLL